MSAYKWCFVPGCTNTSFTTPNKIFVTVPKQIKKRKMWFEAARRNIKEVSVHTTFFCCEDHFILEDDMENYVEYKYSNVKARMQGDVVPHIFNCQPNKAVGRKSRLISERRTQKRKNCKLIHKTTESATVQQLKSLQSTSRETDVHQFIDEIVELREKCDAAIQTSFNHTLSKGIQVSICTPRKDMATSPIKFATALKHLTKKTTTPAILQSCSDDSSTNKNTLTKATHTDTDWCSNCHNS